MKILFIGDICGDAGIRAVEKCAPNIIEKENIDLCIANGENCAHGFGITRKTYEQLIQVGVDAFTMGNHIWSKKDIFDLLENEQTIVAPLNLPVSDPGPRILTLKARDGETIVLMSVLGRVFSNMTLNCPLEALDRALQKIQTKAIIIDVHAETTSEKSVLAWNYAGLVSAVLGTHTHVQTADERVLPGGTAFISDVGMCGAADSVIGVKKELAIARFRSTRPNKFESADGDLQFNACIVSIDKNGRANGINRVNICL